MAVMDASHRPYRETPQEAVLAAELEAESELTNSTEGIPAGTLRQRRRRERLKRDPEAERQARFLKFALAKSDRGSIQDDVEWVYQNLRVTWHQIPLEGVPSPGAVALLGEAKEDKRWFLERYHAKLLPTKSRIEADGWFEADDGQVAEMAARVREEMAVEGVV